MNKVKSQDKVRIAIFSQKEFIDLLIELRFRSPRHNLQTESVECQMSFTKFFGYVGSLRG